MAKIGADLMAAREDKKLSLREVAEATRISLQHLQNLEEGRYELMPGGMYNRAFIRSYCECLGLNPEPYLERYEAESAPPSEKPARPDAPEPSRIVRERSLHPIAAWAVILLVSAGALYWSRGWIARVFSPYFAVPASPLPGEPEQTAPSAAEPPAAAAAVSDLTPQPAPSVPVARPPQAPGTIRIEFEVVEQCWLSVNSDGNQVMVKLLEPGDDEFFDARERFYLLLGNAGGVRLRINGKRAKSLGKSGEVVRLLIHSQNIPDLLEGS